MASLKQPIKASVSTLSDIIAVHSVRYHSNPPCQILQQSTLSNITAVLSVRYYSNPPWLVALHSAVFPKKANINRGGDSERAGIHRVYDNYKSLARGTLVINICHSAQGRDFLPV